MSQRPRPSSHRKTKERCTLLHYIETHFGPDMVPVIARRSGLSPDRLQDISQLPEQIEPSEASRLHVALGMYLYELYDLLQIPYEP